MEKQFFDNDRLLVIVSNYTVAEVFIYRRSAFAIVAYLN